jgi:hypothetical protein
VIHHPLSTSNVDEQERDEPPPAVGIQRLELAPAAIVSTWLGAAVGHDAQQTQGKARNVERDGSR